MRKIAFALIPFTYLLILLFQQDLAMLGDLGRHLKLGEIVVNCLCIPQTNLFSYTHSDFPIVNHEWLGEVIYYFVASVFGLNGLLVFKILLVITAASLIYSVALKKGSLFWVTVFSLLSITIFSMRFFVLPELFSYLLIGLFIFLIEKYKESKKIYLLWILPFLELLWVNMHIYFILGVSIYGFFFLEKLFHEKRFDKKIILIGTMLIASTIINPSGINGALLPFTFSTNYGFTVEENKSPLTILTPSSTNSNMVYTVIMQIVIFEILVGLFAVGIFLKEQWRNTFHFGNGIMAAFLGLKFTRCISLFGLLGFIPLVQLFTSLEKKTKNSLEEPLRNIIKGSIMILVSLVVIFHIKGVIEYKILQFTFVPSAEHATAFMKQTNMQGNIFNNYIIGNYLIYAFYPEKKVYVDARPEAYPAAFFDEYWRMMADEQFFNEQVEKYNINAVVFNVAYEDSVRSRPFLFRLLQSLDWVPVYADGTVTIFVRNNKMNKHIIEQYKIIVPRS